MESTEQCEVGRYERIIQAELDTIHGHIGTKRFIREIEDGSLCKYLEGRVVGFDEEERHFFYHTYSVEIAQALKKYYDQPLHTHFNWDSSDQLCLSLRNRCLAVAVTIEGMARQMMKHMEGVDIPPALKLVGLEIGE